MIRNILFDLDGVLFDGAPLHKRAFLDAIQIVIPNNQITPEYHDVYLNGLSTKQKIAFLIEQGLIKEGQCADIEHIKQTITRRLLEQKESDDYPIQAILDALHKKYQLFCVTNSIQSTTITVLEKLNIKKYFQGFVTNEEVQKPKPNSDIYEYTFKKYNLEPTECLILEDSKYGRTAAFSTRAHVLEIVDPVDVTLEKIESKIASIYLPRHITQVQDVRCKYCNSNGWSRFAFFQ
jgi:beta-phosphoglucomutase